MNGVEQHETQRAMDDYNLGKVLDLFNQRLTKIEHWIGSLEGNCQQLMAEWHRSLPRDLSETVINEGPQQRG